jgi:uncharacterized protein YecE (DUF72 family)
MPIRIGTAGWGIPRAAANDFPGAGSHLERYARILNCAEINSTFYKLPRASTLQRWISSVPEDFRFSLKACKSLTHAGLAPGREEMKAFLEAASYLGPKLGPLLFQLPPKKAFDSSQAEAFLGWARQLHSGPIALEPRHESWFTSQATALLKTFDIARVAADPARVPEAANPVSSSNLTYFRLHGSPRTYYSSYTPEFLAQLKSKIKVSTPEVWVIFDNTASGAAAANALELRALMR